MADEPGTSSFHSSDGERQEWPDSAASTSNTPATKPIEQPGFDDLELQVLGAMLCEGALKEDAVSQKSENQSRASHVTPSRDADTDDDTPGQWFQRSSVNFSSTAPVEGAMANRRRRSGRHRRTSTFSKVVDAVKSTTKNEVVHTLANLIESPRSPSTPLNPRRDTADEGTDEEAARLSIASTDSGDHVPRRTTPRLEKKRFQFKRSTPGLKGVLEEAKGAVGCGNLEIPKFFAGEELDTRNAGLRLYYASIYYMYFGFAICCFALASVAINIGVFFVVRWIMITLVYTSDKGENDLSLIVASCSVVGLDVVAGWAIWIIGIAKHKIGQALIQKFEEFEDLVEGYSSSEEFVADCDQIFSKHATAEDADDHHDEVSPAGEMVLEDEVLRTATHELQKSIVERGLPELAGWDFFEVLEVQIRQREELQSLLQDESGGFKSETFRMNKEEWIDFLKSQLLMFCRAESTREQIRAASLMSGERDALQTNRSEEELMGEMYGVTWMADHSVDACPQCDRQFTMFYRRHHCRFCGSVVCSGCCQEKTIHPKTETDELMCFLCSTNRRPIIAPSCAEGEDVDEEASRQMQAMLDGLASEESTPAEADPELENRMLQMLAEMESNKV